MTISKALKPRDGKDFKNNYGNDRFMNISLEMRKNTNMRFCILIAILKDGQKTNIIIPVGEGQAVDEVNKPHSRMIANLSSKSFIHAIINVCC